MLEYTKQSDKMTCCFEQEKVVITKSTSGYPEDLHPMAQANLRNQGFKAYNIEGEEIRLFEPGRIIWNG